MHAPSKSSEARKMLIPIFALIVAVALGLYLLVTLIAPERF